MNNTRDKFKKISIIAAVIAFLIANISLIFTEDEGVSLMTTPAIDMSDGWLNLDTGEKEDRNYIEVLPGDTLRLSHQLPEVLNDDNVLGYYDYGFRVVAYINDEEIYSIGHDSYGRFGTELSQDWRTIPLKSEYSGKTLILIMENDTDAALRIYVKEIQISYASTEMVRAFATSYVAIIIIVLSTFLATLLIVFGLVLHNAGFEESFHRMMILAMLTLNVDFWTWANSSLGQLLFSSEALEYSLSYLSYLLIPMFLGLFYERIYDNNYHIFSILNITYRLELVVIYFLYLTGIVPLAQSVFLAHVYIFTELLVGNYYGIQNYRKTKNHVNHWAMVGQALFLMVCLVFIPLYYLRGLEHVFLYAGGAFIAFAVSMTMSQGYYQIQDLIRKRRESGYRERSTVDPITGGHSLTGLKYLLEDMDFRGKDAPWFLYMELTNLSAINALVGWNNREKLIRGIYQTNQEILEEGDYQATTEKGEFIFLLPAERNLEVFSWHIIMAMQDYMKRESQDAYIFQRFAATRVNPHDDIYKLLDRCQLAINGRDKRLFGDNMINYYDGECGDRILKSQALENEVNRALTYNKMRLLYFPEYEVETGKLCQADTMLAWNVKAKGEMFEFEFVPQAEKDALGVRMNIDQVQRAMKDLSENPKMAQKRLSVRIFRDCLTDDRFWSIFESERDNFGTDLSVLDVEMPLELGTKAIPILKMAIESLHAKGATVSVANFDGSYGMLQMINELQLDWVKFSPEMLQQAGQSNPEIYQQIRHLTEIFHEQGQKVCICGVTDQKEIEILKDIGADRMRGPGLQEPIFLNDYLGLIDGKEERRYEEE